MDAEVSSKAFLMKVMLIQLAQTVYLWIVITIMTLHEHDEKNKAFVRLELPVVVNGSFMHTVLELVLLPIGYSLNVYVLSFYSHNLYSGNLQTVTKVLAGCVKT